MIRRKVFMLIIAKNPMQWRIEIVDVSPPEGTNIIVGQTHFIKTVEDLYETLVESCPSIKFGIAFNESSGPRLIRHAGNDPDLEKEAVERAKRIGAGHVFVVIIKDAWPINVLNRIKGLSEVACVYAATANKLKIAVIDVGDGRGVLGVIDGETPLGVEDENNKRERMDFLRKIGYKSRYP
jgi:Uncharacterized conserved protein